MDYLEILEKLKSKLILSQEESYSLQKSILLGKLNSEEIVNIFRIYKKRPITTEEYSGIVSAVRDNMTKVDVGEDCIDTAGTGGDGLSTFNISTASAFVLAAAGLKVVKHGNRSASGKCGSADVLEMLGANITIDAKKTESCIKKTNFGFLFAPIYHPSFKNVAEARKDFGDMTFYNFVGPVVNPAQPQYQIIGVSDKSMINAMGTTLIHLGSKKVWLVHEPKNNMDEISPLSKTEIYEFAKGNPVKKIIFDPSETKLISGKLEDLRAGIAEVNAAILTNVLRGKSNPTQKSAVILNAAAGLIITDKVQNFDDGIVMVKEIIESGKAYDKLQEYIEFSNR